MDEHLAFLQSQAAHIERKVYQIKYANIQYPGLVPVDTSAAPWSDQIIYYSEDGQGQVEWFANRGTDIPLVNIQRMQHNVRIEGLAIGYDYDVAELGMARQLRRNLTNDKARVARRVVEEKIDDIFINGVPSMRWDGMINNPNVPRTDAPRTWPAGNALQCLADVQSILQDVWTSSNQVELANTLLLSPERYAYLAQTPLGDNSDKTIMEFLMNYNVYTMQTGQPLMIRTLRQLSTAGQNGVQRMIAYMRDEDVLKLHIPMPLRWFPAQQMLLRYIVPGMFRMGGLEIRRPGAVRYRDGI